MPGEHARLAPSAASRWIACPGSITVVETIEGVESESPSTYAHEGSMMHEVAAICLKQKKQAAEFIGQVFEGVDITEERAHAIQIYVDEVRGLTQEFNAVSGVIEHNVHVAHDCWGTLDAGLYGVPDGKATAIAADAKFGSGVVVPAENNTQLMIYGIGWIMEIEKKFSVKIEELVCIIIQPRTPNPVRRWTVTRDDLMIWAKEVLGPAIKRIQDGDKTLNPGETQCRWCPFRADCSAQADSLIRDAERAFAPFAVEDKDEVEAPIIDTSVPALTAEQKVDLWKRVFPHLTFWMNAISEDLHELAAKGEAPGLKLVEGKSNRKWSYPETETAEFLKTLGVEPYDQKLISPAKAERAVGKKNKEKLEPFIIKPPGKPTLAVADDTRQEIGEAVEAQFSSFADEVVVVGVDAKAQLDTNASGAVAGIGGAETATGDNPPDDSKDAVMAKLRARAEARREAAAKKQAKAAPKKDTAASVEDEFVDFCEPDEVEEKSDGERKILIDAKPYDDPEEPGPRNKRHTVFLLGTGGANVTLDEAAQDCGCSVATVKMHLRYINERDGYGYRIFSDDTFEIYTKEDANG